MDWHLLMHEKHSNKRLDTAISPSNSAVGRMFTFMILGWITAGGGSTRREGTEGRVERGRGYGGKRYEVRGDAREYVRDERGAAGRGWRRSVGRGEAWARRGGDSQAEVKASRDAGLQLRTGGGARRMGIR